MKIWQVHQGSFYESVGDDEFFTAFDDAMLFCEDLVRYNWESHGHVFRLGVESWQDGSLGKWEFKCEPMDMYFTLTEEIVHEKPVSVNWRSEKGV